jgi:UDP:flavonoid glycosyltransferase YjiC (YdhE family)
VLVSLSTSFQNQAELLRRIIAALGTLDLDAVVTAGPAMQQEAFEAPGNVTILTGAPHDAVMREVSVVITHGGHGTVSRALLHHIPLLVMPMGRDQGDNAARVAARGAGLALPPSAEPAAIATALGRVLTEPSFRDAAEELGRSMQRDMEAHLLAQELEAIAMPRLRRSA